ncbi:MAG: hypothetical protein BIFFINMI_02372 [Phycisphaerae bacterium]|nr:hypothetical protein [Phycisphaerae bacterium]
MLAKVAISGGGRCNVTTSRTEPRELAAFYPRGGDALRGPFSRFGPRETVEWFQSRGVRLKVEPDGRMFPTSNSSATVVQCLSDQAARAGVRVLTLANVTGVERAAAGFRVHLLSGEELPADRVLLATGGERGGFALAASLGHTIVPPAPSLFALEASDPRTAGLAGVAVTDVGVRLAGLTGPGLAQRGPMLVTHRGFSGPAILKLSAWAARPLHDCGYRAELLVNWLPALEQESLRTRLTEAKSALAAKSVAASPPPELPRRLWENLVAAAGVGPELRWADLSNRHLHELAGQLLRGSYAVTGKSTNKDEFVTCGGVSLKEVDFATMASRVCPGLFLAGEVLDIDGLTGGFNFQSAWTTGRLAGVAMASV